MRKPLDLLAVTLMIALCVCWGFTQIAVKLIADDVTPMMQMGLRSALAAMVLGALTLWRDRRGMFTDGTLRPGLLVGLLFAVEFLFIAQGLTLTSASHMVVFIYSAPIFSALGLALRFREERLSPWQWAGVLLAFGGIALSFLGGGETVSPTMLLGDALGLLAGLSWGLTTVAIRGSRLSDAPAVKTLFYQVAFAGVMLMGVAAWNGEFRVNPTPAVILNLGYQTVIVTLITYVVWFWLLTKYLASRLSILSFLTPLFGVVFGVAVLHEPLEPSFVVGAVLVLAGVSLVSGAEFLRDRFAKAAA
ncbi:DMT family transporter [Phenylobacterium sp.]|uniref:DMT family transporter n=1 Tax=Phenylobacterium sp. TaxID=1871053 RepID=UPI002732F5E2|nr:DMT family transporter [Phenylobacterium sp.]MDP3855810.1 DMT family transporter [Phenylobacterium sp.]